MPAFYRGLNHPGALKAIIYMEVIMRQRPGASRFQSGRRKEKQAERFFIASSSDRLIMRCKPLLILTSRH